jgi:hypothetical protein
MCDPDEFKKRRNAKQKMVKSWLDKSKYHGDYILYDHSFAEDQECFGRKRRPDFLWDSMAHFVILSVDEFQHKRGGYDCEIKRMGEIAQALGLPTIFIRYNPDEYKDSAGIKVHPYNKVRKKLLFKQLERCKTLQLQRNESDYLQVMYLYYDGFDSATTPALETIDIGKYV